MAARQFRKPANDVADLRHILRLRVVYTVLLKPYTPANIVIGGMSGAMPPVLGWRQSPQRAV